MKRSRTAYTLVEMLVTIALTSSTLTIVTFAFHTLLKVQRHLAAEQSAQAVLDDLAFQLRIDSHQASSVEIVNVTPAEANVPGNRPADSLSTAELRMPDQQRVRYSLDGDRLLRQVERDGKVIHRQQFMLPSATGNEWRIERATPLRQLALHVAWKNPKNPASRTGVSVIKSVIGIASKSNAR